ncbi:MAG: hypothetical protein OHK0039_11350 [Bacteroidia bacterium]
MTSAKTFLPHGISWNELLTVVLKVILLGGLIVLQVERPGYSYLQHIPERYISAVLLFLTAQLIISFSRTVLVVLYRRRRHMQRDEKDNFIIGISQIAGILSFFFFVAAVLMVFNIDIREALTSISIVAAAIAILSKDYVANMINGMIIMFSDQISLHDQIQIGDQKGRIVDINLINVHLVNQDDELILIPNTNFLSDEVINFTKRMVKKVSVEFEMAYTYLQDTPELEAYIYEHLKAYHNWIEPGSVLLRVAELRKDHALLRFQCILKPEVEREQERILRRHASRAVISYINQQLVSAR